MALLSLFVLTGCVTTSSEQANRDMRMRAQVQNMKVELERVKNQVDGLVAGREEIYRKMEILQASVDHSSRALDGEIKNLSQGLQATSVSREQLKQEIINKMSKNIETIIKTQAVTSNNSQSGIEHVVAEGNTLSTIAAAYGVSAKAIIRANNIKNPDCLRIGQTLFIPE
jgi:LysM repeat protein